jgi:tRNA (uracil-5-)-methyltransferase
MQKQVNTLAAEKLYNQAGDWAGLDGKTLLFDVCCGTGTIGLTLAHRVGMVLSYNMFLTAIRVFHVSQMGTITDSLKNYCRLGFSWF